MSCYNARLSVMSLMILLIPFNTQSMFLVKSMRKNTSLIPVPSAPKDQYKMRLNSIEKSLAIDKIYVHEQENASGVTVSRETANLCNVIKDMSGDLQFKLVSVPYSATTIHNFFSILEKEDQKEIIIGKCSFNELVDILLLHEYLNGNCDYLKQKFNNITSSIFAAYDTSIKNLNIAISQDVTNDRNSTTSPYMFMINPAFTSKSIKENFIISLKQIAQFPNESEDFSSLKLLDQMWQKTKFYKRLNGLKMVLDLLMKELEELETQHNSYLFPQKTNSLWNYIFEPEQSINQ